MLYLISAVWLLNLMAPLPIFAADAPEAAQTSAASSERVTPIEACMQKARTTGSLYDQFGLKATMSDDEIIEALEAVDQATLSPEQQTQFEQARQTLTVQARRKLYDTVGHIAYTDITKKGAQALEDMSQAAQKDTPQELLVKAINVYHGRPVAQPIDQSGNGQTPEEQKLIKLLGTTEYSWIQQPMHAAHKEHLAKLITQKGPELELLREHLLYLHCFTQITREQRAQRVGKRPARERKEKQAPTPTKKPTAPEAPVPTPAPEAPKPAPEKNVTQSKIIEASKHLSAALTRLKAAKRYTKDMEKDDKKNLKKQAENFLNENKQLVTLADHVNALAAQGPFHQERYTQLKRFSSLVGDIKREIKGIA